MEKTLYQKLKEQGTQASTLLADTYEFGSLNGFVQGEGATRNIVGELLEKIIQWHKNPNKIFLVLDFAHSAGPSTSYGKMCFSKYNWTGYSENKPNYYTILENCQVKLYLNADVKSANLNWAELI